MAMSVRDPENSAFRFDGRWFRIATSQSAEALQQFRESELYTKLTFEKKILRYWPAKTHDSTSVLEEFDRIGHRPEKTDRSVFEVETIDLITYPWEWTNEYLAAAGRLTLEIRRELLLIGFDLKDASALNIQFRKYGPCLCDIGSIKKWEPVLTWSALKQFVENFLNPLAAGSKGSISSSDMWELAKKNGLSSARCRRLLGLKLKLNPNLAILHLMTTPTRRQTRKRTINQNVDNKKIFLKTNERLNRRLYKAIESTRKSNHRTTWSEYGPREHYKTAELENKIATSVEFVERYGSSGKLVIDIGGNDGRIGVEIAQRLGKHVLVVDPDVGALEHLSKNLQTEGKSSQVIPLVGDLLTVGNQSGILGVEFESLISRSEPSCVICQAVLHHVVITQGIPIDIVCQALRAFNCPIQIEFVLEQDAKVLALKSQVINWTGEYTVDHMVERLKRYFDFVEKKEHTTQTRVILEAF
jgi:hypothetical protein